MRIYAFANLDRTLAELVGRSDVHLTPYRADPFDTRLRQAEPDVPHQASPGGSSPRMRLAVAVQPELQMRPDRGPLDIQNRIHHGCGEGAPVNHRLPTSPSADAAAIPGTCSRLRGSSDTQRRPGQRHRLDEAGHGRRPMDAHATTIAHTESTIARPVTAAPM